MKILGIIPSRYASSRFPGKPLANIKGKSMIRRVYEQAQQAPSLKEVVVATDDKRIKEEVEAFNGNVVMTARDHKSGTDRCFEALQAMPEEFDAVINIQGDEPYIHPEQIDQVASCFEEKSTQIATLVKEIRKDDELANPNVVKVILNKKGEALYFSRSPIPFIRGKQQEDWLNHYTFFKHIGIYGYRCATLGEVTQLPPSGLEKAESLEQLRWLEHGYTIKVNITTHESMGIDTPEDLKKL